jgi:hypothetical protein
VTKRLPHRERYLVLISPKDLERTSRSLSYSSYSTSSSLQLIKFQPREQTTNTEHLGRLHHRPNFRPTQGHRSLHRPETSHRLGLGHRLHRRHRRPPAQGRPLRPPHPSSTTSRRPTPPQGQGHVLSEFGFADPGENTSLTLADAVYDQSRVDYFASYLNALLEAKVEDGVNVMGAVKGPI